MCVNGNSIISQTKMKTEHSQTLGKSDTSKLWIVYMPTSTAMIGTDDGKIYRNGSPSMVFIPIFKNRKDAIKFGQKAKRRLDERWALTKEVRIL